MYVVEGCLESSEKGKCVSWAQIVHQKILSEIGEKDKRKVDKASRLGPMLGAIFQKVNNLEMMFGKSGVKIVPYVRNFKRKVDLLDDDSPPKSSKVAKTDEMKSGRFFTGECTLDFTTD